MNNITDIPDLLRQLRDDTTTLVREEVALVKTEVGEKFSRAARNIAFLAAGGLVASTALLLFLMAMATLLGEMIARQGVEPGMATFVGLLIVAVIAGIAGTMLVTTALTALTGDSIKPARTVQSLREDKQWAQHKMS